MKRHHLIIPFLCILLVVGYIFIRPNTTNNIDDMGSSFEDSVSSIRIMTEDGRVLGSDERMEMEYFPSDQPLSAQGIDRVEIDGRGQRYYIGEFHEPTQMWSGIFLLSSQALSNGIVREILYDTNTGERMTVYSEFE